MDIISLIKELGIPLALLVIAVGALWRAWRVSQKAYEDELKRYREKLESRDDELRELYKDTALKRLKELAGQDKKGKK